MSANLENSAVATGLEKVSFIPITKKGNAKECSNYRTIALISQASKVMLEILHEPRTSRCSTGFRKGRESWSQISNIYWIIEKGRVFQKASTASVTTLKPLTVWITTNCGKFSKRWGYWTTLSASWEICMQVKKQQLELNMEQQTGFKLEKGILQGYILSPTYFTFMQSTSCKMPGWWSTS